MPVETSPIHSTTTYVQGMFWETMLGSSSGYSKCPIRSLNCKFLNFNSKIVATQMFQRSKFSTLIVKNKHSKTLILLFFLEGLVVDLEWISTKYFRRMLSSSKTMERTSMSLPNQPVNLLLSPIL